MRNDVAAYASRGVDGDESGWLEGEFYASPNEDFSCEKKKTPNGEKKGVPFHVARRTTRLGVVICGDGYGM
jgi:hypothetical protein